MTRRHPLDAHDGKLSSTKKILSRPRWAGIKFLNYKSVRVIF